MGLVGLERRIGLFVIKSLCKGLQGPAGDAVLTSPERFGGPEHNIGQLVEPELACLIPEGCQE